MSRRKKRKDQNSRKRTESEFDFGQSIFSLSQAISTESIGARYHKNQARKLCKRVKTCRTVLFGYCYTANILRWATESRSEYYYDRFYQQWVDLNRYAGRVDFLITQSTLKYTDPWSVFLAMVLSYLTDRSAEAIWCADYLSEDASFAWGGHSKSLVALITALVSGYNEFDLNTYKESGNSLVDEVAKLWDFENGVDTEDKRNFAPLGRHSDDETDSLLPALREICLAILDKYDVDYAFNMAEGVIEYSEIC